MPNLEELQKDVEQIKERNKKVEMDKAWETSVTRKIIILVLTYILIVLFFFLAQLPNPFVNAIVPSIGFLLSTLSIPIFKGLWTKCFYKK